MKILMETYIDTIEKALAKYLPSDSNPAQSNLSKAMEYSLMAGGKRIRPVLLIEFYKICGGKNIEDVLPFACAIEMIHTYSLIHDDLPCMDNDYMRRGKPSNHIAFGEDIALLAGDALLNLAFETMLSNANTKSIPTENVIRAAGILAKGSGFYGMIGGQALDLYNESKKIDIDVLKDTDNKKTGALIKAACSMGCVLASADEKKINAAEKYAECLGLAFQIVDDILDITADQKELGKPIKSDLANEKSTYVSILGLKRSKEIVNELTQKSIAALNEFDDDPVFLRNIAIQLSKRRK